MKNKFYSIAVLVLLAGAAFFFFWRNDALAPNLPNIISNGGSEDIEDIEIILDNLEIPWDIAFLPNNGGMLVSERPGRLLLIKNGAKEEIKIEGVKHAGEGGLLGITLHPKFSENKFIYLYISSGYTSSETRNRVERYRLENSSLLDKEIIVGNIPGAIYHDGGRMEFGADGLLYITTGDATRAQIAQDRNSLGGKILRVKDDGSISEGNPFNTAIWSYGHRNPQGIAWDASGRLWETEHGRSGLFSGLDEINLIKPGQNYGWPDIEGDDTKSGMTSPAMHSGASDTWAPASLVFLPSRGSLFLGGLKGEALYEAVLDGDKIKEIKTHFKNEFGRIRTVRVGPDGLLYLTTSNGDGRGNPSADDDKIIRVNPASLK